MRVTTTTGLLRHSALVLLLAVGATGSLRAQGARPAAPPEPDAFGYAVFDQDDPECGFDFVDIRTTGDVVLFTASGVDPADDDGGAALALTVPFELYGEPAASFVISSNGYLAAASSLGEEDGGDFSNDANLPAVPNNAAGVAARVMVHHDDLSGFESGGTAYHQHFAACPRLSEAMGDEACTIFQWTDWTLSGGGDPFDFQAIAYHQSFEIVLQIRPAGVALSGATVGIQNADATIASQYRPDFPLTTDTAVCFFEPRYPPGGPVADLDLTKDGKVDTPIPEQSIGYAIGVLNRGPSPVAGAGVADVIPTSLANCTWTCTSSTGSSCSPAGSGDITDLVDVQPRGWVDYVLVCEIAGQPDTVSNTATVSVPGSVVDPQLANNSATDVAAISAGRVPDGASLPGPAVLRVNRVGNQLVLFWGPSCLPSDGDYEIYEGVLGSFDSHQSVACSTHGDLTFSHALPATSTYYLVVPANFRFEGSYGLSSAGAERPVGVTTCLPRAIGTCP
jgi:uncharacterized repeat protein (TIGR01451 family)